MENSIEKTFINEIVHETFRKKNNNRSGKRAKKLARSFVESFLYNEKTRYYHIEYDKNVQTIDGEELNCDVVIRKNGIINTILMFKFPLLSLKKNDKNYGKTMRGEALELQESVELNSDAKIFFISFYPNLENIKVKNPLPSYILSKCKNIEIFYNVNKNFHSLQKQYSKNIFLNERNNIVEDFNIYNGSFSEINKSIYN